MKFQAVAEKTAKDARGLLYFAAPGIYATIEKQLLAVTYGLDKAIKGKKSSQPCSTRESRQVFISLS